MGFYDNYLSDTHRMIRSSCAAFATREVAPFAEAWEEAGEFPRALYHKAGQAGILGIGFPEEAGGTGGGALHTLMMIEGMMLGRSTGVSVGLGTAGIALPPVIALGTPDQVEQFAKPAFSGEKIAALAVTEPDAGSDVSAVRTRATRDGDWYIVSGNKMFITSGIRANMFCTLVRTGDHPHGGLSFVMIESDRPGVLVSRPLRKTGWWASDTAEIRFEEVRVPLFNRLGAEGTGFAALMENFLRERLALAGYGYRTAELALEEASRYARDRKAFGRPLSRFQVTRHKLVDMATRVELAKSFVYQVASRFDAGESCVRQVSMAKNVAAETAVSVTYDAVQIFGGAGYLRETWVERLSRDARLLPIGGGTQEIMKEIIAREMDI